MRVINTGWVPLLVAAIFGLLHPSPPLWDLWPTELGRRALLWYLLMAPIGEEILFRGVLYDLCRRFLGDRNATDTNPLPIAVWVTSLGFCLWHLQNLSVDAPLLVAFQIFYTFFTGLWLGMLRWKTGKLWLPLGFHCGLNLAANIL